MGIVFDKHFARLYSDWHQSSRGKAMDRWLESAVSEILNPMPGERILDVGCGDGNHLIIMNRLGLDIAGVDASPYMINRARERLGSRCALKTGWAEDLPFEDNAFDLVLLVNTIEFLDDPVEALREAGRVAKRAVFVGAFNGLSWNHLWHQNFNPFGETLFQSARFFYLWELKAMARAVFGRVPMKWQGSKPWPSAVQRVGEAVCRTWNWTHCPACSYLGLGITVVYTVKTDNLPLKVGIRKAGRPVPGGIPMEEDRPCQRSLDR